MAPSTPNALQVISHPELLSWGRDPIHAFIKNRARYVMLIEEANNNSDSKLQKTSVKASIDPDLLENLIMMKKFGSVALDTLTDKKIEDILKAELKDDDTLTIDELLAKLKSKVVCDMRESDPSLRIEKMVSEYLTFLRTHHMLDLITDSPKLATER